MSIHSAPDTTGLLCGQFTESEESAPEQSDAPPYEWDEYNVSTCFFLKITLRTGNIKKLLHG